MVEVEFKGILSQNTLCKKGHNKNLRDQYIYIYNTI